jgi:hypothetical protein
MPRAIFLEKMRSELEKLGPQHPRVKRKGGGH